MSKSKKLLEELMKEIFERQHRHQQNATINDSFRDDAIHEAIDGVLLEIGDAIATVLDNNDRSRLERKQQKLPL